MGLDAITELAGRDPGDLTRRDIARGLLAVPAEEALASLPELRRELTRAGNPMSEAFWEAAEAILQRIRDGAATVGDVRSWLEATGTEPTQFLLGGFLWPEEDERGPVAQEMHGRLIAHLEDVVAAGDIDPDRLLAGDPDALGHYREVQGEWLRTPLEDGRTPMWAVTDEEDEELLAAWAEVDADAREVIEAVLDEVGPREPPDDDLAAACSRLRQELPGGAPPYDLVAAAGGVDVRDLPQDDEELWLTVAAGAVEAVDEPPLPTDEAAALFALQHADWVGAVATLARGGPGTPAGADDLARHAIESEDVGGTYEGEEWDVELSLSVGFQPAVTIWTAIGAIDPQERLTPLGWWGIPEALLRAYAP